MTTHLNWNSRQLTHGWQRGINAFYYGLGLTDDDLTKAQIGIGVPLLDGNLCNVHAYELAKRIAEGCREAGLLGFPFGVPAISDNITQGHEGGNASLPSRNMIANGAECVVSAHGYDALIGLHHCDKNGPGFAMALARLNYPGLVVNGGTIMPGCHDGREMTILDVYDAQAAASVGAMSQDEAGQIIRSACPGPGGCGIAASFNTWGIALEAIGLSLPFTSSIPAVDEAKHQECLRAGAAVRNLLERNIRPRDILTRRAFENAAATIAAIGGSTNGVLHLLALAREAGVEFWLRDLQAIFRRTPVCCSFAPRGKLTMVDLHRIGGTPVLLKYLLQAGIAGRRLPDRQRPDAGREPGRRAGTAAGPGTDRAAGRAVQGVRRHADLLWQPGPGRDRVQGVQHAAAAVPRHGRLFRPGAGCGGRGRSRGGSGRAM